MMFVSFCKILKYRSLGLLTQIWEGISQRAEKSGPDALIYVIFIRISDAGNILPMIAASVAPPFLISSRRFPAVS